MFNQDKYLPKINRCITALIDRDTFHHLEKQTQYMNQLPLTRRDS
jgi:hypothetical protein